MLVLTRKHNETLHIGNDIVITIVRVRGDSVRIGIQAPNEIGVMRGELVGMPKKQVVAPESVNLTSARTDQKSISRPLKLTANKHSTTKNESTAKPENSASSGPLSQFVKASPKVELAIAS